MKYLLDTHVALWAINEVERIPHEMLSVFERDDSEILISVVSIWEIAIKRAIKKKNMPITSTEALRLFQSSGFKLLHLELRRVCAVEFLPLLHGDPFDRAIIAQAQTDEILLVSHDQKFPQYGDFVIQI